MIRTIIVKRMITVGIAFVIFGIIDNGIMVIAGDALDKSIGITLGVSAMFSAGIGNTLSDGVGIASGRWIEHYIHKIIPPIARDELTKTQIIVAEVIGITLGCLIGMLPLLFL